MIINIGIIATSLLEKDEIIISEVKDTILEETVVEVFSPVSKTSFALGGLGLLIGLAF